MSEQVTLATLDCGSVVEQVDDALRAIFRDAMDPNKPQNAKRMVQLQIVVVPAEAREKVALHYRVSTKLAPAHARATTVWVQEDRNGALVAVEAANPRQASLDLDDQPRGPVGVVVTKESGK